MSTECLEKNVENLLIVEESKKEISETTNKDVVQGITMNVSAEDTKVKEDNSQTSKNIPNILVAKDTNTLKAAADTKVKEDNSQTSKKTPNILAAKDANAPEEAAEEVVCAFCKKPSPTKRCAKRHPKCLKKLFCNESCEITAHKKKEDPNAAPKVDTKKADAAKKKKAKAKKENSYGESIEIKYFLLL